MSGIRGPGIESSHRLFYQEHLFTVCIDRRQVLNITFICIHMSDTQIQLALSSAN